jgi:hypothetical protein
MKRFAALGLALVLMAVAASCGGSSNTTAVTAPTGTISTETFTGTVQANSTDGSHTFVVTTAGNTVSVTLLSAGPPAGVVVYLGIGNPGTGGTCSLIQAPTLAQSSNTAQITGTAAAGTYCISVQEFQGIGPITYAVTVAHT